MKCPHCGYQYPIEQTGKIDLTTIEPDECTHDFECGNCECLFVIDYHAYRARIVERPSLEYHTAKLFDEGYTLRANWADAASQIERETEDGWAPTGMQVADYRHCPSDAMRRELEQAVLASGDDPYSTEFADEIEEAVRHIK